MTKQGFTLLELLVVIAIIAVLAAILVPNLVGAQKRAYDVAAVACANSLMRAANIYRIDNETKSFVPAVTHFYGSDETDDLYSTHNCSKLPTGSTITGDEAPDGGFSFEVKHKLGKNTYVATPKGIDVK